MKKAEMKVYKDLLLSLRARLRGDVNAMAENALRRNGNDSGELSSMPIHMADIGSENFDQDFTLSLMEHDGDKLGSIEQALERIEEGVYGRCEECSAVIPKARLNALPFTTHCVNCAAEIQSRS